MTVDGRPLVSLVIPTYQSVGQLSTTLESALSQTYPRIEICVSDHASTDGTWQLLQSYRDRVALRRITAGGGAQRNWNAATEMASGELVKLLCADDLVNPDCVERQVAALEEHPSAALVSAKRRLIGRSGVVLLEQRGLGPLTGLQDGLTAVATLVRSGSNLLGEPGTVLFETRGSGRGGGLEHPLPVPDRSTRLHAGAGGARHGGGRRGAGLLPGDARSVECAPGLGAGGPGAGAPP